MTEVGSVIVVVMMAGARGVGAGFGVERGLDRIDVAAKAFDHVPDDVIGPNSDPVAEQLHGEMAVAEMPGDADQFTVVMGVDFQQRLRAGPDFDNAAVFQRQAVAVAKPYGLGKVDQELPPRLGGQDDPAAVAAVEVDQNFIDSV
jgi:hypothetical protein